MFIIYGKEGCSVCESTKKFMDLNGFEYEYKEYGKDYDKEEILELLEYPVGPITMPQIFAPNGNHIGGFDDFLEIYQE